MKNEKTVRSILVSLGAFTIISSAFALFGYKDRAAQGDDISSSDDSEKNVIASATDTELSVSENKCRGCGKCVRIDPEHFALDVENGVAIVVSTDNLDSEELQQAERACHDSAIVIS